jgi:uncharacterized protein (DUF885 family)
LILLNSLTAYSQPDSSALLKQITDEYWQRQLEDNLYLRIKFGLPITKLPDPTYADAQKNAEFCKSILTKLNGSVNPKELNPEELNSLEILQWECSQVVKLLPYHWHNFPVTPYSSTLSIVQRAFAAHPLGNAKEGENYVALLQQIPGYAESLLRTIQEQADRGIRIPKDELLLVIPFLTNYAHTGDASPFAVAADRGKNLEAGFHAEVLQIIEAEVHPAFQKLIAYLQGDYQKQAPENVGLAQYPDGKEYYKALVEFHTTMSITPEQVHERGQQAVRKLQERMKQVREVLKFQGTQVEFHEQLKKDPRFIPKTADEIGEKLLYYDRRIAPKIAEYFSLKPKAPHTVKRLDPGLEGAMTFGYYQVPTKADPAGTYYYNGANLTERPLFNSASLVYHELVPGHHFQINLQSENESLPAFRREGGHTAFIEGWAEYASALAEEMGMYQDPYELYGRLAAEMFLTVRLVVDTGMNYYGWPRSKAVEFMRANLLESDTQIHTESLRYSCDIPGQALGYKMGMMKFRELRDKTEKALKEKYDIRKFHAAVLGSGSMPMVVLEKHIDRFIESSE